MDTAIRDPAQALKPRRLRRRSPLRFRRIAPVGAVFDVMGDRPFGGRVRAVRRILFALLWTVLAIPVQAVLLLFPGTTGLGRGKVAFARVYWRVMLFLIGVRLQVVGARPAGARTLYLPNHTSWLDILVLGGVLEACFVSKGEVEKWPLIGIVAKLGRSVFVSRSRGRTGTEAKEMRERFAAGDSLVLFPEGTSSDGSRVLPFRSSFLAVADAAAQVQPVSVVYDRLGGLPACRRDRPLFAWYGDMDIGSHAWRLTRRAGVRATVLLHEPLPPSAIPDRKALTAAVERVVAEGAAAMRQNRTVAALSLTPAA
ncbi:lysophospholipid acyltransferase family protein [Roseomonas sp. CCTCC AB2023176]|uniref:lysophospholipid acyltransferase family protein n=1 Tax=Roseomonas sp. CCTCC AB2023176 TaxID=3342640 RepID=UPI0035E24A0C